MAPASRRVSGPVALVLALLLTALGIPGSAASTPRPAVTHLSVASGPAAGGTPVTVTGQHFVGVTKVLFGGTAGRALTVTSPTRLVVTAPAHVAGTVDVRVVTGGGRSPVTAADRFLYAGWALTSLPLPSDAGPDPRPGRVAMDCWRADRCAGVAFYTAKTGDDQAVLWRLSGLHWSAIRAPLPADSADDPAPRPEGISCGSSGVCAAFASYTSHVGGADTNDRNLVWTLADGTWTAQHLPVPPDAISGFVNVDQVACGGSRCAAVGTYSTSGSGGSVLWSRTAGQWTATTAPLPADASSGLSPTIGSLACGGSGTCVALGHYFAGTAGEVGALWTLTDAGWGVTEAVLPADAKDQQGRWRVTRAERATCGGGTCLGTLVLDTTQGARYVVQQLAAGSWTPVDLPVPPDAASGSHPAVDQVDCPDAGSCAAVGRYFDTGGNLQGALWTLRHGTWSAERAGLPADAASNPAVTPVGLACSTGGACVAAGTYTYHVNGGEHLGLMALLWSFSGGAWHLVAPFGPTPADQVVLGLACGPGQCSARGAASSTSGANESHLWTRAGGAWQRARLALPHDADPRHEVLVDTLSCGAAGGCVATGTYPDRDLVPRPTAWVWVE